LSKPVPSSGLTEDSFLGGKVRLQQPVHGYRAAIDPVMLAASVDAGAGDRVLEVGSGHGAAAICLASRVPDCHITGIDIQPAMVRLANDNARLNDLSRAVEFMIGDLERPLPKIAAGGFDHAMANPPFLQATHAEASPNEERATANVEGTSRLEDWIALMLRMVRSKGTLTLIHRADRLDEILSILRGQAGEAVVFPLWPKEGAAAKRVIVRARKGIQTRLTISPGLVLHEDDGRYSAPADEILRGGPNVI